MKISWLGTASLSIESGGHRILFDPYLRKFNKRLPRFPLESIADVEAIFITHPHLDHFSDVPAVLEYTDCPVYTNARGIELARRHRFDLSRIKKTEAGDEFTFGELTVRVYRGRHIEYDRACVENAIKRAFRGHFIKGLRLNAMNKRFAIDPKDDVFAFYLKEGDKTALILGSANRDEGTEYPAVDALVYPYQGKSDMAEYSSELVKSFSPKTVITDHFDDAFPPISARMNVEEFKLKLESESDIKVIIPGENESIVI